MARNIELFDEYVARILSRLYEQFPVKCPLDVREITGHTDTDEYGAIVAPDGRASKEAEIAYATIEWLAETGYLRADDASPPYGYRSCVLSARGLELLKATPQSVRVTETLGDKLVRLVAEGSMELAKDAARAAIAIAVGPRP